MDVSWLAAGTALAQAVGIALMPVWSRIYAPEDFSIQTLFWSSVCIVSVLITWRIECLVQLPAERADAIRVVRLVVKLALGFSLLLTPLLYWGKEWLASMAGVPELAIWIPFVPITAGIVSIATALQMQVQRDGKYRLAAGGMIWSRLGMCAIMAAGGLAFAGPAGLVIAWLGAFSIRSIYYAKVIEWPPQVLKKKMWFPVDYYRRAFGLAGSHLLFTLTATVPSIFVAHSYGAKELGFFALAMQIVIVPSAFLDTAISDVYYQRAAALHAGGQPFATILRDTVLKLVLFGIPAYICFALVLEFATVPIFGSEWEMAGRYGSILSVSAFFSFIGNAVSRTSVILGIWWYLLLFQMLRLLVAGVACFTAMQVHLSLDHFLCLWVSLSSLVYLTDLVVNWQLANRNICKR